ncbi:MAG: energy-coupling factor transporter ATPase [Clostridiales Family XIII bacterium]|jgi:energy-coupling factor transport system ATP-binding protein|nr:energy-coupling factor transporter ATPase [Clostridiales Family XIII bacterium]
MSITVEQLTHVYNSGLAYETKALDEVSFSVESGEFVAIIGHTGSGKSTLIQHLNGILKPTSGTIRIGETEITDKKTKMVDVRKRVGLVFQYPEYQLFEETVQEDVAFGPKNLGLEKDEIDARVRRSLSLVGLDYEQFAQRSPFELSGGQKRRVAIAGVIAMEPELLILDEPTAGLDPGSHLEVLDMVTSIRERTGCTVILVSHNMNDVAQMADRIFIMDSGRIVRSGPPREVFKERDYLKSIGLGLPQAAEVAAVLEEAGMPAAGVLVSSQELVTYLTAQLGGAATQGEAER